MATEVVEIELSPVVGVKVTDDALTLTLEDTRVISAPLDWFPRLVHATQAERDNWEVAASGEDVRWPDLDEGVGVAGLIAGRRSLESEASLQQWLESRGKSDAGTSKGESSG